MRWFSRVGGRPKASEGAPAEARPALPSREPGAARVGVCCSGGGVRSASYCLGALQTLREEAVLGKCDYVSAVSGGSYIASAFATTTALTPSKLQEKLPAFAPGSPEEEHLRNNCSYIAPGAAGKARLLLRVHTAKGSGWLDVQWWMIVIPALPLGVGAILGLDVLPGTEHRERRRRKRDAWSEWLIVVGLVAALLVLALPQVVLGIRAIGQVPAANAFKKLASAGSNASQHKATGHAAGLLGLINVGALATAALGALSAFVTRRRRFLLLLAAFVAGPLLVFGYVLLIVNGGAVSGLGVRQVLWYAVAAVAMLVTWKWMDLTQWSLHPFYRRRLNTAFCVRRDEVAGQLTATEIPGDAPLYWETLGADPAPGTGVRGFPRLVVCAAANATEGGATPPGRAAVPFVFTSEEIGVPHESVSPRAYRQVADRWRFLSVPAAVAMSGAAVSPLMGKKTIRAVRFLMALMNVRLGVWMPNPARLHAIGGGANRPNPFYLFKEMLGLARLHDPFLYVTDGGHFDNLGLIELLRRGCTTIFCLDGGGDPPGTYRALGEAVALARSELQVEVRIDPTAIAPAKKTRLSATDYVIGEFRYRSTWNSPVEDPDPEWPGTLVYCRAAVTADAPFDVLSFAQRDKRFPDHSTFDQLFNDEKFESYRALGAHTATRAIAGWRERAPEPPPAGPEVPAN